MESHENADVEELPLDVEERSSNGLHHRPPRSANDPLLPVHRSRSHRPAGFNRQRRAQLPGREHLQTRPRLQQHETELQLHRVSEATDAYTGNFILSCKRLRNGSVLLQTFYGDIEAAKDEVRKGRSWAAINFRANFSDAMRARVEDGRNAESYDIESSTVDVYQDISSRWSM